MRESFFKFKRPIVKDMNYTISDTFRNDQKISIDNKITTNYVKNPEERRAIVELHIELGYGKSENSPFRLSLTIIAEFQWEQDHSTEKVDILLRQNSPALLLSYARPIVSNITANSVMTYDIPFMDFTARKQK